MSSLFQFVDLDGTILNLTRKFAYKTKIDSQHAVKKVLDPAGKWKISTIQE